MIPVGCELGHWLCSVIHFFEAFAESLIGVESPNGSRCCSKCNSIYFASSTTDRIPDPIFPLRACKLRAMHARIDVYSLQSQPTASSRPDAKGKRRLR